MQKLEQPLSCTRGQITVLNVFHFSASFELTNAERHAADLLARTYGAVEQLSWRSPRSFELIFKANTEKKVAAITSLNFRLDLAREINRLGSPRPRFKAAAKKTPAAINTPYGKL